MNSEHAPRFTAEEQLVVLKNIQGVLYSEGEQISVRPDLFWQSLYNRLQWMEQPVQAVLGPELERKRTPRALPWLRLTTPLHESPALERKYSLQMDTSVGLRKWRIEHCTFSRDGTYLAAIGNGTVFIWNVKSGRKVRELATSARFCWFGPDDQWFVTMGNDSEKQLDGSHVGSSDGEYAFIVKAQIWNTQTWRLEAVYQHPRQEEAMTRAGALSHDGCYLVAAADDKITVWDFLQGGEAKTYHEGMGNIRACAFAPNGKFFVSCDDHEFSIWDIETWRIHLRRRCTMFSNVISDCAVTLSADKIITSHQDAELRVWDAKTGQLLSTLVHTPNYSKFQTGVLGCAISPNGAWAASAGADQNVKLWDIATGRELATFEGHTGIVRTCAFSPDGSLLASGGDDSQVMIWKTSAKTKQRITAAGHTGDIKSCSISSDGTFFVTTSEDKTARAWNMETGALLHTLFGHTDEIRACAISPDSSIIITGADDEIVRAWNAHTGKELAVLRNGISLGRWIVNDCAFSPDGSWFISALDHRLELWDVASWTWQRVFPGHDEYVHICAISPDSSWIASGDDTGSLKIWNPATAQLLHALEGNDKAMRRCAVSPDGKFLTTAEADWIHLSRTALTSVSTRDRSLLVWDTSTWQLCLTLHLQAGYIVACSVTPDGKSIVAASENGAIKLWDITSGQEQATFTAPGTLFCMALHPWKPFAVAGGPGGAIYPLVLETVEYGPIVVTAHNEQGKLVMHCPVCRYAQSIQPDKLGHEIICQGLHCQAPLRVNSFALALGTVVSALPQDEGGSLIDTAKPKRSNRRGCRSLFKRK